MLDGLPRSNTYVPFFTYTAHAHTFPLYSAQRNPRPSISLPLGHCQLTKFFMQLSGEFDDSRMGEAVRLVGMTLRVERYSPSLVPGYEHLPTIHVVGQSDGASIMGPPRRIHGTVGVIADGSVRWMLVSAALASIPHVVRARGLTCDTSSSRPWRVRRLMSGFQRVSRLAALGPRWASWGCGQERNMSVWIHWVRRRCFD